MAFEWKLIGENTSAGSEQTPNSQLPTPNPSTGSGQAVPTEQQPAAPASSAPSQPTAAQASAEAVPAEGYQPTPEAIPGAPRCEVHNAAVNTTEKAGYNAAYDAEVYSSYDTGVNAEENSVVA
jgi:hypothetical protein